MSISGGCAEPQSPDWSRGAALLPVADLLFDLTQPEAEAVHLDYVAVMEQAIEDRRRQRIVSSEHLRPLTDGRVGGDELPAPLVAVADYLEEQVGLAPLLRLEAELDRSIFAQPDTATGWDQLAAVVNQLK